MKYRSRIDIASQIIESASSGDVTKTQIMYKAFLSYSQLREYLTLLVEQDLLEYQIKTSTYRASQKGIHFLRLYHEMDPITTGIMIDDGNNRVSSPGGSDKSS